VTSSDNHISINKFQIKKMLEKGLSTEDVAEILGISQAKVEAMSSDAMKDNIRELDFLENKKIVLIPLLRGQMKQYEGRDLAIKDDYFSYYPILRNSIFHLGLGEIYVALKKFSGNEGLKNYDPYKVSFRFPFLVKIKKDNQNEEIEYILIVHDFKGGLEFLFHKIINEDEKEKFKNQLDTYSEPFNEELTRDEMNDIIGYIAGYIEGITENINEWHQDEFSRSVEAIKLKYGFKNGSFYQYQEEE